MARKKDIEVLFRLYYRPLCLYALRLVDDSSDAEDIVQSSFTSLWECILDGRKPDSPKSYLYRIVHNRCVDYLRKGTGKEERFAELTYDVPEEETVDRSVVWARLWENIDRLPPKRRRVLLLSKRDGKSHAEIAQIMGISERTVHNQLSKAIRALRRNKPKFF